MAQRRDEPAVRAPGSHGNHRHQRGLSRHNVGRNNHLDTFSFTTSVPSPGTPQTMAEPSSEIQIHVKGKDTLKWRNKTDDGFSSGANELKLQITIKADKTVQDLKHAIAEKTDAPAERQRLIYSGKVLKVQLSRPPISPSHAYQSSIHPHSYILVHRLP
jgi:ubiquilin